MSTEAGMREWPECTPGIRHFFPAGTGACSCGALTRPVVDVAEATLFNPAGSLDAAWREAEAALPAGWRLSGVWPIKPTGWEAGAGGNPETRGTGPTPTAALQALTLALRDKAAGR